MQESEAAINALHRLKSLGVRLAVDDFGTGYSSLAYLARFPLDILKVDRTFVSSRARGRDDQIARAIVDLARSLGLQIIAEGIEREEDWELMKTLGAQLGQGFYMARPTSGEGALSVMRATPARSTTQRSVSGNGPGFRPPPPETLAAREPACGYSPPPMEEPQVEAAWRRRFRAPRTTLPTVGGRRARASRLRLERDRQVGDRRLGSRGRIATAR